MYAYLKGILAIKQISLVVIDCGGVGYELNIPLSTYDKLPAQGETVHLFVQYQFSETDGARLYGFFTSQEKDLFRLLLGVSKIGPRTAMAVLSTLSYAEFSQAILESNYSIIATVPGIGKKSAERLVLELKDKIKGSTEIKGLETRQTDNVTEDALAALVTLGFSQNEIGKSIAWLTREKEYNSAEALIKDTIKVLHGSNRK